MAKRGMGVEEAVKFVQAKRPEADPNSNFIAQLHEFHNSPVHTHPPFTTFWYPSLALV